MLLFRIIPILLALFFLPHAAEAQRKLPRPRAGNIIDRLHRMPPDQRQRWLEKLPPERRARIEQQLKRYQNLPPARRKRLRKEYEAFRQLPPEKQETVRKLFRKFNDMPEERRGPLRRELQRLRRMDGEKRRMHLESESFKGDFSSEERRLLEELAGAMPSK